MRDFVDIVALPDNLTETLSHPGWTIVTRVEDVPYERGIAALVEGEPVAIFRLAGTSGQEPDAWYAVSHVDPVALAPVMARGLLGSCGPDPESPTVASPLHKRRYDLATGACLDDDTPGLKTFSVLIADEWLLVS